MVIPRGPSTSHARPGSLRTLLAGLAALALACAAQAAEVTVAVAANFAAPMQKIAAAFQQDTGHRAVLSFGSTGAFHAQIRHGAPFDLLLSADAEAPARMEADGHGVAGTRFTYAMGRLVLWSAQAGLVDDRGAVLRSQRFHRLAMANPKHSPYGVAAMQTLAALGLPDALQPRLVQGENIAQVHQFVASGNAQIGFVAQSQVSLDGRIAQGSAWVVPATLHAPIRQDALLLVRGQGNPAARALLDYLRGERARTIIRAHGYTF